MATYTPNLNLKKPLTGETYDVTSIHNDAMDKLDIAVGNNTSQLAEKANKGQIAVSDIDKNKGKFDQTYMTDDFLQQIAGTAPINAVPAINSLVTDQFAFPVLSGYQSPNLFDKTKTTDGYYINNLTGTLITSSTHSYSAYMPVVEGQQYSISTGMTLAFYNNSKVYISGRDYTEALTFNAPIGAKFIRISCLITQKDSFQFVKGNSIPPYESYGSYLIKENIHSSLLNYLLLGLASKNLFDKSKITSGKYINYNNGVLAANVNYFVSDYLPVIPGVQYTINGHDQSCYFTDTKTYISGEYNTVRTGRPHTFTPPANAKYMRICAQTYYLNQLQMEQGTDVTEYEPYGIKLQNTNLPSSLTQYKTLKEIMLAALFYAKKIKLLGDSITAGVGGTGYSPTGNTIFSSYKANDVGVCYGNMLRDYFETKTLSTVKNWGISGVSSQFILDNINSLVSSDDDIVIVMIGTNDRTSAVQPTLQGLYNNISLIAQTIKAKGKDCIIMSSIPSSIVDETNAKLWHMEDVNNAVASACVDNKVVHISLYNLVMDYIVKCGITIDSLLADQLHPNDAGYKVMFEQLIMSFGYGYKRQDATW